MKYWRNMKKESFALSAFCITGGLIPLTLRNFRHSEKQKIAGYAKWRSGFQIAHSAKRISIDDSPNYRRIECNSDRGQKNFFHLS